MTLSTADFNITVSLPKHSSFYSCLENRSTGIGCEACVTMICKAKKSSNNTDVSALIRTVFFDERLTLVFNFTLLDPKMVGLIINSNKFLSRMRGRSHLYLNGRLFHATD